MSGIIKIGTQNTSSSLNINTPTIFTTNPKISSSLVVYDNSSSIPTTAWVNSFISSGYANVSVSITQNASLIVATTVYTDNLNVSSISLSDKTNITKDGIKIYGDISGEYTEIDANGIHKNGDLVISVVPEKKLTLDIPFGSDLEIGPGATSNIIDGGFSGMYLRVLINGTYYKLSLLTDN
jgi:hypothetical protein